MDSDVYLIGFYWSKISVCYIFITLNPSKKNSIQNQYCIKLLIIAALSHNLEKYRNSNINKPIFNVRIVSEYKPNEKPKRSQGAEERNVHAMSIWRRVRLKLEGRDPDHSKRSSVQEQVQDY